MCNKCESTKRYIWPPSDKIPEMPIVEKGNWALLRSCPVCKTLWVESPYEPYASFRYLVQWRYPKEAWTNLSKIDEGRKLLDWHKQEIRENWKELSKADQKLVEGHRQRAYFQYSPIDLPVAKRVKINDYMAEVGEHE